MKHLYYRIIGNLIWYKKRIKLIIKHRTFNASTFEPSSYEDLSNF